jgi:hypothetical protein
LDDGDTLKTIIMIKHSQNLTISKMKNFLLTLIFPFLAVTSYSQCDSYFNFKEGAEYELEHYSAKEKLTGKSHTKIVSIEDKGGVLVAHIEGTAYDKKGKELTTLNFEYMCEDGVLKMDLKKFIPQDMYGGNGDVSFEMEGDYLEIPRNLTVGQTLKDGTIEGKMIMEGNPVMANMTMTVRIFNRKVASKEDVTTPAGTFSCYKITYDMESSTKVMGMNTSVNLSSIDYLAEGIGVVRTESYNKKGNLSGYTILTAYK